MKKITINSLALLFVFIAMLESCQKSPQGLNGADGTKIISGAGIPATSSGAVGDFFIDTIGKVLWGPKNTASWGAGIALVGPQGLPGKSTLSGTVAPAATLGGLGDFYINTANSSLYGPKTNLGWGSPTSLIGTTGATGATGATGSAGTPAQVIYSPWVTSPYALRDSQVDGTCLRIRHIDAPSLSATILNQGVILVYFRTAPLSPVMLPYISEAGGAPSILASMYSVQKITFSRYTLNTCRYTSSVPQNYPGQPIMINLPQTLEYRYVLIPGLLSGGRLAGNNNQLALSNLILPGQTSPVDLTNKSYSEVCKILGIRP